MSAGASILHVIEPVPPMTFAIEPAGREDLEDVRELVFEYLCWVAEQADACLGEVIDVDAMLERSVSEFDLFLGPTGRLLLAREGGKVIGVAFMKGIRPHCCEIKRMYVRPEHRGRGIGRGLLSRLIEDAGEIGCSSIVLDSARYMASAHALYRSMGFEEIDAYPETEMGEDFRRHMVYMAREV